METHDSAFWAQIFQTETEIIFRFNSLEQRFGEEGFQNQASDYAQRMVDKFFDAYPELRAKAVRIEDLALNVQLGL